jgi:hypothetical protein
VATDLDDDFQLDLEEPSIEELEIAGATPLQLASVSRAATDTTRIHRFAATMEQI